MRKEVTSRAAEQIDSVEWRRGPAHSVLYRLLQSKFDRAFGGERERGRMKLL